MNVFILYIEDDESGGDVHISAEVIGDPQESLKIGEAVMTSLMMHPHIKIKKRSVFTQDPPTERLQ
jgi:hypothetical protein